MATIYSPQASVKIDGTDLSADDRAQLERVVVDFHQHLPGMFTLTFDDTENTVISDIGFDIGSTVEISAKPKSGGAPVKLIEGEITALEGDYSSTGKRVIVRGYDVLHELQRGKTTETYQNVTTSDVVQQVVNRAGLPIGSIDSTSVTHDQVSQPNLSDWDFLKALCRETGYEMLVEDGKFYFRQPQDSSTGPSAGTFRSATSQQLVFGNDLLEFRPRVTAAAQVGDVKVRGWDPDQKQIVVGSANAATKSATLQATPTDMASDYGSMTFTAHDRPLADQSEADDAAASIAEQLGSAFSEAEGVTRGNPALKAGTVVNVAKVADPFSGTYTLSQVRHVFEDDYRTHITVGGRQERSLLGLSSGGSSNGSASAGGPPINGVVVGTISDNNDPNNQGRVKVRLPWLSDDYVTDWARIAQLGAGPKTGALFLPENGDEVLVAFEFGDIRRPYVVGNLYNGQDLPKPGTDLDLSSLISSGEVKQRGFISRRGHQLIFYEDDSNAKISIVTSDGNFSIVVDEQNAEIHISAQNQGKVTIESQGDMTLDSKGNINLKAQQGISLDAKTSLDLKGETGATLDGGPQCEVKSSAQLTLTGKAMVSINDGALQVLGG